MQILLSAPRAIRTEVALPASKSISNRALVLNALSGNTELPLNLSDCDDTRVMVEALAAPHDTIDIKAAGTAMRFLTAYRSITPGTVTITGTQRMRQRPIRILVDALRALGADIQYTEQEGFPPLKITGRQLTGSEITLKGDVSSQYISALLMIAPTLPDGLTLRLQGEVVSRPYINLTLQLMHDFGAEARWTDPYTIEVPHGSYRPTAYSVESDWSAASYWYQIVALAPQAEVRLKGLFAHSYQGDSAVAHLFERLGVKTTFTADGVMLTKCSPRVETSMVETPNVEISNVGTPCERNSSSVEGSGPDVNGRVFNMERNSLAEEERALDVRKKTLGEVEITSVGSNIRTSCAVDEALTKSSPCVEISNERNSFGESGLPTQRFDYDFVDQPDLAQTFVVTCALMGVPFRFTGLQSLKIKETDRIAALRKELLKLGYVVREADDSVLYWDGERCPVEAEPAIDTYEDHRMAMAFAPACLVLPELRINNPEVVSKSYPAYWDHLAQVGFYIREAESRSGLHEPQSDSGGRTDCNGEFSIREAKGESVGGSGLQRNSDGKVGTEK